MLIILCLSIILLAGGLVGRLRIRPVSNVRGPVWRTRAAFATQRDFVRFLLATVAISAGSFLLVLAIVLRRMR